MSNTNIITREYNGNVFTFREDGYFNMTDAAKKFGKDLSNFMRSPETVEYVEALTQTVKSTDCPIVQAFRGGRTPGTWGHPKLAVFFARWLDVKFAVFCDMVIDDILNKKAELTITKPEESMAMKVPKSFPEALRLAAELEEQRAYLAHQNQKLAIENEAMAQELNVLTVDEFRALSHLYFEPGDGIRMAKLAVAYSKAKGLEVSKQWRFLPRVGRHVPINVYHREALEYAAEVLGLI